MNQKGIALIMAVGVLALLAIIGTSFALNMRLEYHAATNYYNGVKARYFAEAALQRAIAELRAHVKSSAFDDTGEAWAQYGYSNVPGDTNRNPNNIDLDLHLLSGTGTSLTTAVKDEQRKVNINKAGLVLLRQLLTRCGLGGAAVGTSTAIYNERNTGGDYKNIRELRRRVGTWLGGSSGKIRFDMMKDYITTNSYVDGNTGFAPININTADSKVLESVIWGINDGTTIIILSPTAITVSGAIISARPINSWSDFDSVIDTLYTGGTITDAQATLIKNNCNPNRTKPPVTSTTEFCFNSGGYYNVAATGAVTVLGLPIASRTLNATVRIYKIYSETTKAQFEDGTPVRVTWLDSCPVNSTDLFGSYTIPINAKTTSNSVKLGYWDDFDEMKSDGTTRYASGEWVAVSGTQIFTDADSDGDFEITDANISSWGKYVLNDTAKWTWDDAAVRIFCFDVQAGAQMKEVGWFQYRDTDPPNPGALRASALHTRVGPLEWGSSQYAYENPVGSGTMSWWTDAEATSNGRSPADKYQYSPGQIRIFPSLSDDQSTYRTNLAYSSSKTHNIVAIGGTISDNVYTSSSNAGFTISGMPTTAGRVALYGQHVKVAWDDIRIISPSGNFTSQTINSTFIPVLADSTSFAWGTIATTVTIPSTASAASETVTVQTKSSSDGAWVSPSGTPAEHIASTKPASGAASIQYKAFLVTGDPAINETPVLEDVTITYLPKVAIKSYSLSN